MGNQQSGPSYVQTPEEIIHDQWVFPVTSPMHEPYTESKVLTEKFFWGSRDLCVGPVKLRLNNLLYSDFELKTDGSLPPLEKVSLECCRGSQGNTKVLASILTETLPVKCGVSHIAYRPRPHHSQYVYFNITFASDVQDPQSILSCEFQSTYKICEDDPNSKNEGIDTVTFLLDERGKATVTAALIGLITQCEVLDDQGTPVTHSVLNNGRAYPCWMDMCVSENGYHYDNATDTAYYEVIDALDRIEISVPDKPNSLVQVQLHWVTF